MEKTGYDVNGNLQLRHFVGKGMAKQVAGQLNYRSVHRPEQHPVQEKSYQCVENLQIDAVSVPLENIPVRRCFAIFRLDDR